MKLLNNKILNLSLIIFTFILYFSLSMAVKFTSGHMNHNIWKGYYTLVLPWDAPVQSVIKDLQHFGGWDVLSEYNSEVKVFNYNNNTSVPVYKLKDFYVDGDSLYDPFLKKLPLLFVGKSVSKNFHIVYIKSTLDSKPFYRQINNIMKPYTSNWFLPEIKMQQELIFFVIFAMAILLFFFWHKELWPVLLSGIFPWIQFLISTGLTGLIVSILFIFSLELLGTQLYSSYKHFLNLGVLSSLDKKKLSISLFIITISFLYIFINFNDTSAIISFFIAVTAHLMAVICYILILTYKSSLQQHRIFFPVRIKFHIPGFKRKDLYVFSLLVLFMLISPFLHLEDRFNNNIKLPVPVKIEGVNDFSAASMEVLNSHSINSELPNLSDYISHMVFLTTYPYGFKYSFPKPDTKITVPEFTKTGNSVLEKNVSIYMFTDSWYESIINGSFSSDIVKLLLRQDSPDLVSYRSGLGVVLTEKIMLNHYRFTIILIFVLGFWLSSISISSLYFVKEFLLRRKRQIV